jgi:hypothetical protein
MENENTKAEETVGSSDQTPPGTCEEAFRNANLKSFERNFRMLGSLFKRRDQAPPELPATFLH